MLKNFVLILFFTCQTLIFGYPYSATISPVFDKSPGPFGWFFGKHRKVQTYLHPETGKMVGSYHTKLNSTYGTGTMGGMLGDWEGTSLMCFNESVYTSSIYQSEGNLPGGRFPDVCEFINGYLFGIFNDYDTASSETVSQPMYSIGDANFGYSYTDWSEAARVESSDSASVIPNAWRGTGDVVYDPATEYYYWVQGWKEGPADLTTPVSCVVGKTQAPGVAESWEWSDYKDLRFDTDNITYKYSDVSKIGPFHFSYAKDTAGNGTGKGIGVAVTQCYPWYAPQLSYTFTTNWGQDWNKTELGFHHQQVSDLFDWVGESLTLTDSIKLGYSLDSLCVVGGSGEITINYARIMWDISVITTEDNIVHVLCMVFPASSEYPNCIFPWTNSGFRAGYYDIRGEITDTGVTWQNAVLIANPMTNWEAWPGSGINSGMEFVSDINRTLSLSYAGNGNIFATWLDRPGGREMYTDEIPGCRFRDDGFLIISLDNGDTWQHDKIVDIETGNPEDPVWYLKYAANVTKTSVLHEEGWCLSNRAYDEGNTVVTYAGTQYAHLELDSTMTFMDYERDLQIWKAFYTKAGIEPEDISIATDFELYQNYPNPFNPETEIKFALSDASTVKLRIFNSNGQLVKTLFDGKKEKGYHTVKFNGEDLNSGLYFYRLDVNGNVQTRKMIMLK